MPNTEHQKAAEAYAASFYSPERVAKHINKFSSRIDTLRSEMEIAVLAELAEGDLFDCSLGFGRLIGRLPAVVSYAGMDKSADFVNYVAARHPGVVVAEGDLLVGIDQPSERYDTVICIRTLPVLPDVPAIIAEMARITASGGRLVITYGPPRQAQIAGHQYLSCAYDIAETAKALGLKLAARIEQDWLLTRIKKSKRISRLFHSRFNLVPDGVYAWLDRALSSLLGGDTVFYLLEKPRSAQA